MKTNDKKRIENKAKKLLELYKMKSTMELVKSKLKEQQKKNNHLDFKK